MFLQRQALAQSPAIPGIEWRLLKPMLLNARDSILLVVDVQEKLAPAVAGSEAVVERVALLMRAAVRLDVPVLVSEHYPAGIGRTVPALAALAPEGAVFEKISFSCLKQEGVPARFHGLGRRQVVLCGMEAHVCVLQSALSLLDAGFRVYLAEDATGSRQAVDRDAALRRVERAGGSLVTAEMVVFEWLERGDHAAFRELLALVK